MPHMYNSQLPLSLQGAVVSLVFPPFVYNRDSYKFETLAVMIGAIHLFLSEGVLPTDRKMVFLDNETVLSHLISDRGGGGGLIDNTFFFNKSTSCTTLFLCNVLPENVVYSRMRCQFSIRTSVDHGCVSRHLPQLLVFCFFSRPPDRWKPETTKMDTIFFVRVLHE